MEAHLFAEASDDFTKLGARVVGAALAGSSGQTCRGYRPFISTFTSRQEPFQPRGARRLKPGSVVEQNLGHEGDQCQRCEHRGACKRRAQPQSERRAAAAIASAVISSWVGPIPPVVNR